MVFTGLRVSDARNLKWTDIAGDVLTIRIQKTQQPHTVPLIPAALHLLDAQRLTSGQYEQVFRIPNDGVNMLNRWATSAGIAKRIGFHTARRTFASLAAQRGVDVGTIKSLLGHSTLQMALRYAQVNLESKRNAVMMLETAHQ
jgi:integrase